MSQPARERDVETLVAALPEEPNYWDRTWQVELVAPDGITCSCCGEQMAAEDDHGRFICFNCGHRRAF